MNLIPYKPLVSDEKRLPLKWFQWTGNGCFIYQNKVLQTVNERLSQPMFLLISKIT